MSAHGRTNPMGEGRHFYEDYGKRRGLGGLTQFLILAASWTDFQRGAIGTLRYLAPELCNGNSPHSAQSGDEEARR
jgi:hypothetical protein